MTIDLKNVGHRLEALRLVLGLQRGEFATTFGLDPSSYTKTVKGEKALRPDAAYEIAEKWGVTMDYLYRGRLSDLPADLSRKLTIQLNDLER